MKVFKTRGLVLREYEAGESDKRLILLCKEHGRLTVYARGARKTKSKFMAAAQIFTYGDFVLTDGRQFHSLSQADVIESFYPIRNDYARLCHAYLAAEICEKTVLEDTACDDLLLLLLKTLTFLSGPETARLVIPPEQASCVFLLRFYLYYGLAPETALCSACGDEPAEGGVFFCSEGILCPACARLVPQKMPLSQAALSAMRYILHNSLSQAFSFKASASVLKELTQAGRLFWASHFQIKLQSESLLK